MHAKWQSSAYGYFICLGAVHRKISCTELKVNKRMNNVSMDLPVQHGIKGRPRHICTLGLVHMPL